jgi:hypothetical protein
MERNTRARHDHTASEALVVRLNHRHHHSVLVGGA